VENVLDIIEVVASAERKINIGNYESVGVFFSAKATVPRQADPTTISILLQAFVARQADLEEDRIRNPHKEELHLAGPDKPPVSPKPLGEANPTPPAQKGEGVGHPTSQENNQPSGGIQVPNQGASNGASGTKSYFTPIGDLQKAQDKPQPKEQGQGAPICPTHGTAMRKSKAPGKDGTWWFCPKKIGTGPKDYCKERM
jgi:hypothetical protein